MKTPKKILVGFILLLGLTLSLVIGANSWKSGLIVSKIVVVGARVVDVNEIIQLAHVKAGTKMYDLDLMVIERELPDRAAEYLRLKVFACMLSEI